LLCALFLFCPVLAVANLPPARDAIPKLRPPHAEIPPTFWEQHGTAVIVGGVLVLGLGGAGAWLLMRPKPMAIVPPEVQAREALEELRQKAEDGVVLSRVSQILRRYFAAVFPLPQGELTTAEFCSLIQGIEDVGPMLATALTTFLRQCDERKFAPGATGAPLGAVAQALAFIEQAEVRRGQLALAPATLSAAAAAPLKNSPPAIASTLPSGGSK
jgi:hypothetical protein